MLCPPANAHQACPECAFAVEDAEAVYVPSWPPRRSVVTGPVKGPGGRTTATGEGEGEEVEEEVEEGEGVKVLEWVGIVVADGDKEGRAEAVRDAVSERVAVGEGRAEGEGVLVSDRLVLRVRVRNDFVAVPDTDRVPLGEREWGYAE